MSSDTPLAADRLLNLLSKMNRPLRLDDLLRLLDVNRRQKKELLDLLQTLLRSGKIVHLPGGRWVSAPPVHTIVGVLSVQPRSGAGWVSPLPPENLTDPERSDAASAAEDIEADEDEDAEDESADPSEDTASGKAQLPFVTDIYIGEYDLNEAWHGDIVEVTVTRTPSRRRTGQKPEGRVVRVIRRQTTELAVRAGTARTPRGLLCQPLDEHYPIRLDVDLTPLSVLPEPHELIAVRVGERLGPNLWQATAVKTLGSEKTMEGQERLVRLHLHIPDTFPPAVIHAANLLETAPAPEFPCVDGPLDKHAEARRDLRHLPLVTIDGEDARDFDDAICVETLPDGRHLLWVAIADVSHYIPGTKGHPSQPIDVEARSRGTSVYFPRSVTPMLPEILCNNLCSLRPDEDRPVMVARMVFGPAGEPGQTAFYPGLMRSRARLTYETVQAFFDGQANDLPAEVAGMLGHAAELARKLISRRADRGGLDLDLPEAGFDFTPDGTLQGMHRRARLFSHRLIEAFMLAANEAVATFLLHRRMAFPLRTHPAPDPERVSTLCRTLQAMGLPLPAESRPERPGRPVRKNRENQTDSTRPDQNLSAFFSAILSSARGKPEAPVINRLALRALMQARYVQAPLPPEEMQHFGLASEAYCHFTSPIRRYPDLDVHRALKHALRQTAAPTVPKSKRVQKARSWICEGYNQTERRAQDAEREIHRRLACLVLEPRVGEIFTALVVSVNHFGLFVEPEEIPVEGLVRVDTLPDDWYEFDEDRLQLLGQARGLRYQLGQTLRVRLTEVNLARLEVNFVLEGVAPGRVRAPRPERRAERGTDRPGQGRGNRVRSGQDKDETSAARKPTGRPKPKKSGTRKAERPAGSGGSGHSARAGGSGRRGRRGR